LAELAPDEAGEVLTDLWDFWPVGPRPAVQRLFAEALIGQNDTYPAFIEVADRFEANGEFHPAARAMAHASRVAPSGGESLVAHRRALDLYRLTDAERGLATLLRDRRIRREPGTPTIPESQRHAVNAGLTARERQVTELAAEGLTGREIAAHLGISEGTVRNHLQHARQKLGGLSKRDFTRFK
jgi:DNA-binding CsgD family transcriptional regulator